MTQKQILFLCACMGSLFAAMPVSAQLLRVDSSRTVIRDQAGNVVGTSFSMQVESIVSLPPEEWFKERIRNEKIAFFTRHVNLTPTEAEKFWPVYNEYFDKLETLQEERSNSLDKLNENYREEAVSEKEIKMQLDRYMKSIAQESTIRTEYYKKFLAILPPKKVVRIYHAEVLFKRQLLHYLNRRGH